MLLDKLDTIREELRSDKVFDVIGRLFENRSLREYMIEALTEEGEQRVLDQVTRTLDGNPIGAIEDEEARVYGRPGAVAEHFPRFATTWNASVTCSFCLATCAVRREERRAARPGDPRRYRRLLLPRPPTTGRSRRAVPCTRKLPGGGA